MNSPKTIVYAYVRALFLSFLPQVFSDTNVAKTASVV